jgi:uncharacterized protein (TIGR02145 family)
MIRYKTIVVGFAVAWVCAAQSVTISGKVTTTEGAALSGALVSLEKGGHTAITGPDGGFSLKGSAGIIGQTIRSQPRMLSAKIRNGVLYLNLEKQSSVMISAYNVQGRAVSEARRTMAAGMHAINLRQRGAGVYYYKVQSGASEVLIKSHTIGGGAGGMAQSLTDQSFALAKQAQKSVAINDVIAVTKSGYLNYRVIVTNADTTGIEITMIASAGTLTDIDGNVYQAVKIGNQVWTTENLRTTRFTNGDSIPHVTVIAGWSILSTPAYVLYNNTINPDSVKKFGALYNWLALDTKKLAPAGWHVPSTAEWDTLQNYLIAKGYNWDKSTTGNKIGKCLAAQADWIANNVEGSVGCDLRKNNSTGFSAMPGGSRYYDVNFNYIGSIGYWWSSDAEDAAHANYRMLNTYIENMDTYFSLTSCGFSIRLVKD